jgi:hypothetical protein
MIELWLLVIIINGMGFHHATYPSQSACYGEAMLFYAEMMEKDIGEVICASKNEIVYVTREMDSMNAKMREARKNPPPPRPWKDVEEEFNYKLRQCHKSGSFGSAKPDCEKIVVKKNEMYQSYKKRGLQ